ncbi:MAG: (2Fe-2S)-binding protein [Tannerellaceae bacterium]|nr:(2Fe-2S)-binding protein [Tannerellaceae bacterium]
MKKFFFITILFTILSCNTTEQPAIYGLVYLDVDLSSYHYRDLKNLLATKTVTTPLYDGEKTGYAGVLLVHGLDDVYYAYELACPYEASQSVRIEADDTGLEAECPKCGSIYNIAQGGLRVEGPTTYNLTRYNVIYTSSGFTVRN